MAWNFGDGFDLYATNGDAINGYWDSGGLGFSLATGRFSGSRCCQPNGSPAGVILVKSSGVNDAVHHFVAAFQQTTAISGSNLSTYLQLSDGATGQCCIVFRQDGAILLTSGTPGGTVLATYTGAFPVASTWYAFEFEIVVNNATGSFAVRKNGNTVNDFTATALNTRGGTANNYANRLTVGLNTAGATQYLDDLFWRSDASSVAWLGDIRCYTRMPASDQSVTFSKSPTNIFGQGTSSIANSGPLSANNIRTANVVAPTTGVLTSLTFNFSAGITGHAKMALYDGQGANGHLLATSAELTNPGAGVNTFAVASGPTLQRGVTYYVALWSDVSITGVSQAAAWGTDTLALTYTTSFPSTMTGSSISSLVGIGSNGMNMTPTNSGEVNEPQQDGLTTYVYDSNPGDADFYGIASIASTPSAVIATTIRAYAQKSDAGARTMAVRLKSGATTVASPTLTMATSGWLWAWRTDLTDPNTGAAWTAAGVNNAQIGPTVIA